MRRLLATARNSCVIKKIHVTVGATKLRYRATTYVHIHSLGLTPRCPALALIHVIIVPMVIFLLHLWLAVWIFSISILRMTRQHFSGSNSWSDASILNSTKDCEFYSSYIYQTSQVWDRHQIHPSPVNSYCIQ